MFASNELVENLTRAMGKRRRSTPDKTLPEGIPNSPSLHHLGSEHDQLLASALRNLNAHSLKETLLDVAALIPKECERSACRKSRCWIRCVQIRIKQYLGNKVFANIVMLGMVVNIILAVFMVLYYFDLL